MNIKNPVIKWTSHIYLEFMRIMPQMVLLFLAYFGITHAFGLSISGEAASIWVFTLWGTAEMGDLVRGALQSIPKHQYESGRAIGLTERQIFFYIIIPQTIKRLVPLCMNPEVLLFDEVTAALDPEMVREVLDVMMDLAKEGRTMLIVTHQLEFARAVADRIVFIDEGVIVEEARPEEFFTNPKTERAQKFLDAFKFEKRVTYAEGI